MAATKELLADASAYVQLYFQSLEQVAASSSGSEMLGNRDHKIQKITNLNPQFSFITSCNNWNKRLVLKIIIYNCTL